MPTPKIRADSTQKMTQEQLRDKDALDAVSDEFAALQRHERDGGNEAPAVPHPQSYQRERMHGPMHDSYPGVGWEMPSKLAAPPCPDDMQQRWIRIRIGSEPDVDRLQNAWEHGWRPRPASSVEEQAGEFFSRVEHNEFGQVFMRRGLLLMWRKKEIGERWAKYLDHLATQQMVAVDEQMYASDSRASQYVPSRRSTVTVGGRKPNVPSD